MSVKVVVGLAWGDEGKAKIVDYLTKEADFVVRFQGGANAGHTVIVGGTKVVFHLIPAGIMHPGKKCIIGNGVVLDLDMLTKEIEDLKAKGISTEGRLLISPYAHLVMPYHKMLDQAGEAQRGDKKIGTTAKGIGPCYQDKVARSGLRVADLMIPSQFQEKLSQSIYEKNRLLERIYDWEQVDEAETTAQYLAWGERIKPYVTDTAQVLHQVIAEGRNVLFEGAQGSMLDVDYGTYPFVTSSNTIAGAACTGSGIGPTQIDEVIGIVKAYTSRVGNGPFPTELDNEIGAKIREIGKEYGATTGRPRRCGWLDAVVTRHTAQLSGVDHLAITRLDILDSLPEIQLCTAYRYEGQIIDTFPVGTTMLEACEPVYETWEGWMAGTSDARTFEELPTKAQRYLERISELVGVPIGIISVGPERTQTILR
jgi:adenylosuccinate synthase